MEDRWRLGEKERKGEGGWEHIFRGLMLTAKVRRPDGAGEWGG